MNKINFIFFEGYAVIRGYKYEKSKALIFWNSVICWPFRNSSEYLNCYILSQCPNNNNLFQVEGKINQLNAYTSWTSSYGKNWVSLCHNCSDHWTLFCCRPSNKRIQNESTFTTFCYHICSTLQYPKGNSRVIKLIVGQSLSDCVFFFK